jgi:ribosomal protein L3
MTEACCALPPLRQVNGGSVEDKVDFAYGLFEKPVPVDAVFQANEMIDAIAITKGRGTEGVVTRWGVSRLPRKTHRGLRKARNCMYLEFTSPPTKPARVLCRARRTAACARRARACLLSPPARPSLRLPRRSEAILL